MKGIIREWAGRFGFISPDDPNVATVFIHQSELPSSAPAGAVGLRLEFDLAPPRDTGKHACAVNVRAISEGADDFGVRYKRGLEASRKPSSRPLTKAERLSKGENET
jgi:cold shock CspA family protein